MEAWNVCVILFYPPIDMAAHKESQPLSFVRAATLACVGIESELTLTFTKKRFCSALPEH